MKKYEYLEVDIETVPPGGGAVHDGNKKAVAALNEFGAQGWRSVDRLRTTTVTEDRRTIMVWRCLLEREIVQVATISGPKMGPKTNPPAQSENPGHSEEGKHK